MSEEKEYSIGVWECSFYMSDGEGGYEENPDGSVKLFDAHKDFSWSHIAEYVEEEDLVAVPEEQKVLLVTLHEQNGEREYYHYCYYKNFNTENIPPEKTIIEEFFGELGEEDEKGWWVDCSIVSVYESRMISKEDAEVLKRYSII